MRRVKKGNQAAFDLLFTRYQHRIHQLISRFIRDPEEVLNVAQEASIKAWRALPQFRGDSQFYTWLYRIAVNCAKNHLAGRDRRPLTVDLDMDDEEAGSLQDRLTPTTPNLSTPGTSWRPRFSPRLRNCPKTFAAPLPCVSSMA